MDNFGTIEFWICDAMTGTGTGTGTGIVVNAVTSSGKKT
jgi:hypothetical protein